MRGEIHQFFPCRFNTLLQLQAIREHITIILFYQFTSSIPQHRRTTRFKREKFSPPFSSFYLSIARFHSRVEHTTWQSQSCTNIRRTPTSLTMESIKYPEIYTTIGMSSRFPLIR